MSAEAQSNDDAKMQDLFSVPDLAKLFPDVLSVSTLRWQLRQRDTNGLAACTVKVGKKLMIYKTRYERWLAGQTGRAGRAGRAGGAA